LASDDYTVTLVEGVLAHRGEIDATITRHARDWSLHRMPAVDRSVLRIAVFELNHSEGVPPAVVIDEAVRLVTELSTDESPAFVNGVLGAVLREQPADADPV
jgi:N utilization substance protein B